MSLACACDLIVAAESARFTMAYTAAGLSPDGGGSWFLPRIVGRQLATELILTNRVLCAAEAHAAGLVARVVPDEDLASETEALAGTIAAGAPGALSAAKRLLNASSTNGLHEQLELEAAAIARNAASADGIEGVAAFLAKRRPEFRSS
jgi:2-(1,2-epoxy-1,2-dihydrophenyl)acetyl-CoA isomerase